MSSAVKPRQHQVHLLLIGGGHSHVLLMRYWAISPIPNVQITLVSQAQQTPYSGMLPGYIAGLYSYEACHIDLQRLSESTQVNFICDRILGIDADAKIAYCRDHPPLSFDLVSIDIGSTPQIPAIPGVQDLSIGVKPVPAFLHAWKTWLDQCTQRHLDTRTQRQRISIIGGGMGGIELALAMQTRCRRMGLEIDIHLCDRGDQILAKHSNCVRRRFAPVFENQNIHIHLEANVRHLRPHHEQVWVDCDNGERILSDLVIWVTHASAPEWLQQTGLKLDQQGFIAVLPTLQSESHPYVFAAGDIASMPEPCPKAGVFAVRHAKPLWENIVGYLHGKPLKSYQPQRRYLSLIGVGIPSLSAQTPVPQAIAVWGSFALGPFGWIWRWKAWLDRQFMQQFHEPHALPNSSTAR